MDWWLKFGCFLTGYNYHIVKASSEVSAKTVKRYTSAMIIICLLWSFVGYTFAERYVKAGWFGSIVGGIVMCLIIVQIERQIILSIHKNNFLFVFRGVIAIMMAVLGSIIIDQMIFKEDIEQKKILLLDNKVNSIYPLKAKELKTQISELDTTINSKELERKNLVGDLSLNPTIKIVTSQVSSVPVPTTTIDSTNKPIYDTKLLKSKSSTISSIENPKMSLLAPLDNQIAYLRQQKSIKDNAMLTLRESVEKDIKSKVGFLDELNIMISLVTQSLAAMIVYVVLFLFLFGLEMFILVSKWGDNVRNDYDETVIHQMDLQLYKLKLLAEQGYKKQS